MSGRPAHAGWIARMASPSHDADRPIEHQGLAHPALLDDPGLSSASTKARLEPSHPGHSPASISIDAIIDPQSGQGGHDMLDHLDDRRPLLDRGAALGRDDLVDSRGNGGPIRQVGSHENDPGAGFGRIEPQRDVRSVEKTEPTHFRRAGDRALGRVALSIPSPFIASLTDAGARIWLVGRGREHPGRPTRTAVSRATGPFAAGPLSGQFGGGPIANTPPGLPGGPFSCHSPAAGPPAGWPGVAAAAPAGLAVAGEAVAL